MADDDLDIGALYDRIGLQDTKLAGVISDVANIKGTVESTNAAVLGLQQSFSAERGTDWPVFISGLALIVVVLGGIFGFAYSILGTQLGSEQITRRQIDLELIELINSVKFELTVESIARRDRMEHQIEGREKALKELVNERQAASLRSSTGHRDRLNRLEAKVFGAP
jgi:hypothetical protein